MEELALFAVRWFVAALLVLNAVPAVAQRAALRGQVTDESGAVVPAATVALEGPPGTRTTKTGVDGSFVFADLPAGEYTVRASAPQLGLREPATITVGSSTQTLNLVLYVLAEKQELTVEENTKPAISTEASGNASAVVIRGSDLDALSDNPDDLAADLQALAGPAAGPDGGTIFIDGFSGSQLPPKNSIREIRINQNPFSAEYDKLGFGRVEIFTKPGTDKFHADLGYNFATDKWNSRNPYAAEKAPFLLNELREMVSGPLGKRASFNLTFTREWVDNGNAVNAVVADPRTLAVTPFTDTPVAELRRTGVTPRIDYQLSTNHTLSVRYSYNRDIVRNAGTGGFNLESRGYHNDALAQTLQVTEMAVVSTSIINESRFQYFRPTTVSQANVPGPAIQVLGSFNGGGNPIGRTTDLQNNFELQNNTSVLRGTHSVRFGFRLRAGAMTNVSPQNYAGTFTFSGGLAPQLDANFRPILDPSGQPVMANISSIESYERTLHFQRAGLPALQIRQMGGGASQFSINAGNAGIAGNQLDVGVFAGDDWRIRPNLTLSLGLRYETQTNIHDWTDFAPRIGVAWAPGAGAGRSRPKSVIRAGFGMFYDRFALGNVLTTERYDGVTQQQYFVANPDFYPIVPRAGSLPGPQPSSTIQTLSPSLRAPYLMQSAVSFERQLPFNTTMAVTYANSHGLRMLRSRDTNAPLPGSYDPEVAGSGVYPLGRRGLVVQMESSGRYNQNQMILNVNSRVNSNLSLTGSYAYGRAMSDTDGLGTFPANPYSMQGEYGPAGIDVRHRVSLSGTINAKWGIRFNPLLTANTGPPFDITAGRDLFGDTLFNDRPGIATDPAKPGVVRTPYGLLDPNPAAGQALVPRNYGRGPGQIMLNMRVSRTFVFGSREGRAPISTNPGGVSGGPGGGGPGRGEPGSPFSLGGAGTGAATANRRYSLVVSMQIRNLLNHNNPGPIIGNITSPLFGQANQPAGSGNSIFSESANNRRLELQMRFTF
ncbi:MAG: TonB-dependent receptor [Bryobacterales bacterium]|nr:TonB-dependent receptor [Bryobacterales bacterium]